MKDSMDQDQKQQNVASDFSLGGPIDNFVA